MTPRVSLHKSSCFLVAGLPESGQIKIFVCVCVHTCTHSARQTEQNMGKWRFQEYSLEENADRIHLKGSPQNIGNSLDLCVCACFLVM